MTYQPAIATLSRRTLGRRDFVIASLTASGGMMLGLRRAVAASAANEPCLLYTSPCQARPH